MIFRLINKPHGRNCQPMGKNTGRSAGADTEITPRIKAPSVGLWETQGSGCWQNRCGCLAVAIDQLQKYFSMLIICMNRLVHLAEYPF